MGRVSATAFSLILLSSILTGCLSSNEGSRNDGQEQGDIGNNEYYESEGFFVWIMED